AHDLKPYFAEKAAERKAQAPGRPRGEKRASVSADLREETARERKATEQAAKAVGASGRAVEQYERVEREAPDLAEKVKSGEMALDRAERIVRDRKAEQERVERARREAEAARIESRCDIRQGVFREVLSDVKGGPALIYAT